MKKKTRTTLKNRLFFLTSLPIVVTLTSLIAISLYWTINYTWQHALKDVSDKLKVVEHSVKIMQEAQQKALQSYANSYSFKLQLYENNHTTDSLNRWITKQDVTHQFDYIQWKALQDIPDNQFNKRYVQFSSFFDVLTVSELRAFGPTLVSKAEILLKNNNTFLTEGLVLRTVVPVSDQDGRLLGYLDGVKLLNNSHVIVDKIRDLIYPQDEDKTSELGTVTIFLNDIRISTNVMSKRDGGRVLGTMVSEDVRETVLVKGENYIDHAYVFDGWYVSAYQPITDYNQHRIGILYTGYEMWPFVQTYLFNLLEIALLFLLILLISGRLVLRNAQDILAPIYQIASTVKGIKQGKSARIGNLNLDHEHELTELGIEFDRMLDLLEDQKNKVRLNSELLEQKVSKRTESLRHKTIELEKHISLLNETRDKLVANEKLAALGKLTAGIAHEINNPITIVLGSTELLKLEFQNSHPAIVPEIENIITQIDRVTNITASLLQYSKAGNANEALTEHKACDIINEVLSLVRAGSHAHKMNFVIHFSDTLKVECFKNQLFQILINIIVNAIQSMNGVGYISIFSEDWYEQGQLLGVAIHVKDNGCGISTNNFDSVFEPFYTTKPEGTGLGLAVSHSLISQIGGSIKVKSQLGIGSTFSVYLKKTAQRPPDLLEHQ